MKLLIFSIFFLMLSFCGSISPLNEIQKVDEKIAKKKTLTQSMLATQISVNEFRDEELHIPVANYDIGIKSFDGGRLQKTIFSSKVRLLFVAGLEGSGHHALSQFFDKCNSDNKELICSRAQRVSATLMSNKVTRTGLFFAEDVLNVLSSFKNFQNSLFSLALEGGVHLFIIGLDISSQIGMMSYPNFNHITKSLDHPDVFVMASAAERAGLDFRILVLSRKTTDVLASTKRRHIGGAIEPYILIDNASILYAQLAMLDQRFFYCIQYERLSTLNVDEKSSFLNFIHPELLNRMDVMFSAIHNSSGSVVSEKVASVSKNSFFHFQLESRMKLISQLCQT